jgi:hypothetical protein
MTPETVPLRAPHNRNDWPKVNLDPANLNMYQWSVAQAHYDLWAEQCEGDDVIVYKDSDWQLYEMVEDGDE